MFIYCLGFLFVANPDDPARPKVVLIKKKRGPPNVRGRKNGIGGKVELPDETPLAAMIRETREEIGIVTDRETWLPFGVMSGPDWRCHLFTGWMPDGQEPVTMEDEEVSVELAANCASYVSNIPVLLALAEHALNSLAFEDEPVWVELAYHAGIDAHVTTETSASTRSLQMWSTTRPRVDEDVLFEAGDLRVSTFTIEPGRGVEPVPEAPIFRASDLLGGYLEFGGGRQVPIVSNTATAWTYEPPNFAVGVRADDTTIFDTDQDAPAVLTVLSPSEETVAPTVQALLDATATIDPIQPFELDLSRYLRSEMKDVEPDAQGNPMASATSWVDYAALANDMEAARLPGALVQMVRLMALPSTLSAAELKSLSPGYSGTIAHEGVFEYGPDVQKRLRMLTRPDLGKVAEQFMAEMKRYGFYGRLGYIELPPYAIVFSDLGASAYLGGTSGALIDTFTFDGETDDLGIAAYAMVLAQRILASASYLESETLPHAQRSLRNSLLSSVEQVTGGLLEARRKGGEKAHVAIGREVPPTRSAEEVIVAAQEIIRTAQAVAEAAAQAGLSSGIDAAQMPKAVVNSSAEPILGLSEAVKPIVVIPGEPPMLGFINEALGAYCPTHMLLAWAAMGQAATPAQRTVRSEWGIAFSADFEPVASFSGDEVELFWAPVGLSDDELAHFVPIDADRIRWPFVESSARQEHFVALGFRVLS